MSRRQQSGFTVVELIIVIIIIAVLVVISTVAYNGVTRRAHESTIQSDLDALSDRIDLEALDEDEPPTGGMLSTGTGTATTLIGIQFTPTKNSYDTTVANLYYCKGEINGNIEYAIAAKAKGGANAYVYRSVGGTSQLTGFTFASAVNGTGLCTTIGFSAPYSWSYGYDVTTGWADWADF